MKLKLFKSLRFRLPGLVLLGVIPTTIIAIAYASYSASNIIRQEKEEQLALKAKALNNSISRWNQMNVLALQNLSKQPDIVSMEPKRQKPVLMEALKNYQHLYTASTTDLNGINVTRSDDKAPKKYPDRPWFQGAKAGNDITYQTLIGRTSKKPSLCLSVPIKAEKIIQGVNYICMTLETLTEEVGAVKFGKTGYGFIVNKEGRILGHPDPQLTSGDELRDYSNYPPVANFLAGKEGYFPFTDEEGIEWLSYGTRLNNGWGVFILQQKSEAFLQQKKFQQLATMIAGVAILAVGVLTWLLASRLTQPISKITAAATNFAEGELDQQVDLNREDEIGVLANSFNKMAQQLQESLANSRHQADEQRQAKQELEEAIYTLIDEVSAAMDGDLTVRANLNSLELSTVADLFNAIIDNLQEIAIEAKQSTTQVGDFLTQNESAIRLLAERAIAEAEESRNTLMSVEQMSQSIQTVAQNANQAEQIVDDTFNTLLSSSKNMNLTVESILNLRTTVGKTANKMKRLGESSQKISQAVSLIEEIALKTNVLAINASAEADRAGEYGQGFAIVAEQVGSLAEQCTAATKEIAKIVTTIQAETEEVSQEMKSGNVQVVQTTDLVESTQEDLRLVLEKSQKINQLIGSISQSTVSQANTSQDVTNLMQKIAQLSETTSKSSQEVAESIVETARVAAKLQSTVAQFKVAE